MRVYRQIARVVKRADNLSRQRVRERVYQLLAQVGIREPAIVGRRLPHELSGGMCQRVLIAMALARRPLFLLADEPTTALDVTVQAQIFELIRQLASEDNCGVVFISHDLAAVSELCENVVVMYGGQIMEYGLVDRVIAEPAHPYTRTLIEAADGSSDVDVPLAGVDLGLSGCRFAHRCPFASDVCDTVPPEVAVGAEHAVHCWNTGSLPWLSK